MGYVYRSQQSNIDVGTPIIGLPGDIIFINIPGGFDKYNGCYFLYPYGSTEYNQLTGQYGSFGYGGVAWEYTQIWGNASNDDMILLTFIGGPDEASMFQMLDLSYYNSRNVNDILYKPYLATLSGVGSQPYEWIWDKNFSVGFATSGPLIGRSDVPGDTPQAKYLKMEIPCRRILGVDTTPLIVQGGTCVI